MVVIDDGNRITIPAACRTERMIRWLLALMASIDGEPTIQVQIDASGTSVKAKLTTFDTLADRA